MIYHVCIRLEKLLVASREGVALEHPDGTTLTEREIVVLIAERREKGYVFYCPCDNIALNGSCGGHETLSGKRG